MKQYCNLIYIYLSHQVEKIQNGLVIPKPGQTPIPVHAADFDIVPTATQGKSSLLVAVNLTLYIDKIPSEHAKTLRVRRAAIVQLNRDGVEPSTIGTPQYPAQVIHTTTLNTDILKIEHKQPSYI